MLAYAPGLADELSRSDKLRVLYSNQFAFDKRGLPMITVRIAEGQRAAVVESTQPVRLLPGGEGGPEVVGGKRWKVSLTRVSPAKVEHFAVLGRQPTTQLSRLRQQITKWKQRNARPSLMEIGTVFGVKGKVFDNRAFLLVDGPYPTSRAARRAAEGYVRRFGLDKAATVERLKTRPSGLFEATDLETGTRVKAADAIWFKPAPGRRISVAVASASGAFRSRPYWGQIYVTVGRNGTMAVVNSAPADRMLAGLVPAEIFASAPMPALKVQAVAARGELLAKLGTRHLADPYLLCSTVHCQVYAGAGHEHPRTTKAVNATRGMGLVRRDGSLVDTVYSAACGGHTEHNDNVWPSAPNVNLRGHLDAAPGEPTLKPFKRGITAANLERWLALKPPTWCSRARFNRDKLRWTKHIPSAKMSALTRHLGVGSVKQIHVRQRGVSGRARLVDVVGSRGTVQVNRELTIRRLFGNLRSSMFIVRARTGAGGQVQGFDFRGGGWGHGVGMCQTGAMGMAGANKTYKEILLHYYPGSEVRALY